MAEMTLEQRKAVALAKARVRLKQKGEAKGGGDIGNQHVDAATVYVDDMLFGLPGKAAAGLNAVVRAPFTDKTIGEEYDTLRNQYQNAREQYAKENPGKNAAASIAGSIHGGEALTAGAGSLLSRIAPRAATALQSTYLGRMAGDAASGAAQGGLSAYGHDEDVGKGALIGGVIGGASRPIVSAGGAVLDSVAGMVGVGNTRRAQNAVAEALSRSGRSVDDVASDLAAATADGQPGYMVADALGNSGQRMLSGVVRSPGDMRQQIVESLQDRQAGQGERLINALSEGFDAKTTANQARQAMTEARDAAADVNYGLARGSAVAVDPTEAIRRADEFLQPGAMSVMGNQTGIADDSVEGAVKRARSYLTDGTSVLSNFDAAFRAKIELDNMITGAKPGVQRQLIPIRNALDDALAAASDPYAAARNQFRRESQAIAAIDEGLGAASSRTRAADNVEAFNNMTPEQQRAFRQGYADQLIGRVESASVSPSTNKARMLMTEKTGQEFPAFAAQGQADRLGDRIAREQRMFQTANAALGGSKTADNLADIADIQSFDPSMLGALMSGNLKGAAIQGLTRGVQALQGRNQQTRDMIARALMESGPTRARAMLTDAASIGQRLTRNQEAVIRALIAGGAINLPGAL